MQTAIGTVYSSYGCNAAIITVNSTDACMRAQEGENCFMDVLDWSSERLKDSDEWSEQVDEDCNLFCMQLYEHLSLCQPTTKKLYTTSVNY